METYTDKNGKTYSVHIGPKGGKYYEKNGRKVYIKDSYKEDFWLEDASPKTKRMARLLHYIHDETVRRCEYCNAPMSRSDVNDYGSLCEKCYEKEYY